MRTVLKIFVVILHLLLLPGNPWAPDLSAENLNRTVPSAEKIRFGFTQITLGAINGNDATAAIRIWTRRLTEELDIPADPVVNIYKTFPDLVKDLEEKRVDVLYMTTPQWFEMRHLTSEDGLLTVEHSGATAEEYVLLTHQDSGLEKIRDLKGKTLKILDNARTSLIREWLSNIISENGLDRYEYFFKKNSSVDKVSKAVLPVFFRQADACLVTRSGFETMGELNPQVARQLKILELSQPYVPVIFCFRKDYQSPLKHLLLNDMQKLVESSSGGQLLTIFQMGGLQHISLDDLGSIDSLLASKAGQSLMNTSAAGIKNKGAEQ